MKDFYRLDYDQYPSEKIKIGGLISEKNEDQPDLSQVIIKKNTDLTITRYLVLQFHRFCSNYKIILLSDNDITKKDLYDIVYNFYNNTELSLLELKSLNDDDVHDYITDATIKKKDNPNVAVNPIDIMGNRRFIEYISVYEDAAGDIQYTLHLGS